MCLWNTAEFKLTIFDLSSSVGLFVDEYFDEDLMVRFHLSAVIEANISFSWEHRMLHFPPSEWRVSEENNMIMDYKCRITFNVRDSDVNENHYLYFK